MSNKIPKVTFKNDPRITGLSAVGNGIGCDIKVNGKAIGRITGYSWNSPDHRIMFMVQKDHGEDWEWVTLKYKGSSLKVTKEWLKENWENVFSKWGAVFRFVN